MPQKIIVVGGVAGGASAAAKARRVDEHAEIIIFERGRYVSFANCGLPYYVGGAISKREALLLQTPESFWKRFRVKVYILQEVLSVDRPNKKVKVKDLATSHVLDFSYDKLILATGAGAIIPPLPGIQAYNIFTVKTVPDSDKIKEYISKYHPKRVVVVGGGFIGLESAEALKNLGLQVTLVEALPQILPPFDPDMARFVADQMTNAGIDLVLGDGIKSFQGAALANEVELQSGRKLPMDFAILSIGVRPELKLAQDAGLMIGHSGGISVNEYQQTSDPNIYAAGDAVEIVHLVTGEKTRIPLAGPANKQGRVAGANAAGGHLVFPGAVGTAIVECMGITAAKTGLSEREAEKNGLKFYSSQTHSLDHAGYYPGSSLLHMKMIVEIETGRLLGAQVIGEKGVDKRIDVLATALFCKMKVSDVENLDLAYAPQFSSAKDPVIMAGFVASNIQRAEFKGITCQALQEKLQKNKDIQIVDVRTREEVASGSIPQAILIPLDELRECLDKLNPEKETVVYCKVGLRGYLAARILEQSGFHHVFNLTGGLLSCPSHEKAFHDIGGKNPVSSVNVHELKAMVENKSCLVIDVREKDEFRYEFIPQTKNIPLSQLNLEKNQLSKETPVYVMCQAGARSRVAVDQLRSWGFTSPILVEGGLQAWKNAGFSIKKVGPLPLMRQVQIVAGVLILIGSLLPGFKGIAIFVGAGLVFAGASGWCGMAMLLQKMPWNQRFSKNISCDTQNSPCSKN